MSRIGTATTTKSTTTPVSTSSVPHDKIAKRAYEKWVTGGCKPGCDVQNWLDAEAELKAETCKTTTTTHHTSHQATPQTTHQGSRGYR